MAKNTARSPNRSLRDIIVPTSHAGVDMKQRLSARHCVKLWEQEPCQGFSVRLSATIWKLRSTKLQSEPCWNLSFAVAAEPLHKSIVKPHISPSSEHFRALQRKHEALLKTVKDITGDDAPFIRWNTTGPVRPPTAG
jgi:hypothetical protein